MTDFIEKERKADINISTAGDNIIVAAPGAGHYIAIDFLQLVPSNSVTLQFKDGSTNYGGQYPLNQQQVVTLDNSATLQDGVITCSDNQNFVINLSAGIQCGGFIRYRIIGN